MEHDETHICAELPRWRPFRSLDDWQQRRAPLGPDIYQANSWDAQRIGEELYGTPVVLSIAATLKDPHWVAPSPASLVR